MSPVSLALLGGFFTTEPLGKSHTHVYPLVYSNSITFIIYACMYVYTHTPDQNTSGSNMILRLKLKRVNTHVVFTQTHVTHINKYT